MRSVTIAILLTSASMTWADDVPARKGVFTFLGTIKGEIDKVSEGGRRIEVKYKELVATTRTATNVLPRSSGGKMRMPAPKELVLKEKNQELDLRLLDESVIRLIDVASQAPPRKSSSTKSKKDDSSKEEEKQDDSARKPAGKSKSKKAEPQYPGKPGNFSSLAKGQIVLVDVYREDFPGYSRLVAHTIYILGEK
jgi:hypothetical protein